MNTAGSVALTTGCICNGILVMASALIIILFVKRKQFNGLPWNVIVVLISILIYGIFTLITML